MNSTLSPGIKSEVDEVLALIGRVQKVRPEWSKMTVCARVLHNQHFLENLASGALKLRSLVQAKATLGEFLNEHEGNDGDETGQT